MALGDILILEQNSLMSRGARLYNVSSATALIYAGEPVQRSLGGITVSPCATNAGTTTTDFIVGIAATNSTQTSTAVGTVNVNPLTSGMTLLIKPSVAALWDTQAEYDALVGKRVLIDLTASSYTLLASDSATNGCIIMPLDIAKYPGKVAFAFRQVCSDMN